MDEGERQDGNMSPFSIVRKTSINGEQKIIENKYQECNQSSAMKGQEISSRASRLRPCRWRLGAKTNLKGWGRCSRVGLGGDDRCDPCESCEVKKTGQNE